MGILGSGADDPGVDVTTYSLEPVTGRDRRGLREIDLLTHLGMDFVWKNLIQLKAWATRPPRCVVLIFLSCRQRASEGRMRRVAHRYDSAGG